MVNGKEPLPTKQMQRASGCDTRNQEGGRLGPLFFMTQVAQCLLNITDTLIDFGPCLLT
jgi:hypothetical protein